MKYAISNTINAPLDVVYEKIKDPEGIKHWMEGLQKIDYVKGEPGEVGSVSELHFLHKKKEMIIKETVLENELPARIKFEYESKMGGNTVELQFESISDDQTKQTSISEFHFGGVMKLFSFLFKGMMKKQSAKYMDAFRDYVEDKN